jgi:DNA-3-methyladenine glycosylase
MLSKKFFDRDAIKVAKDLLGKVIRVRYENIWLSAKIIETEAYYLHEKGSHSSLGFTNKRKALFMPAGTIYMYYARGSDSLNISCHGEGNAVLIKSGFPYIDNENSLALMQHLNPKKNSPLQRDMHELCCGQTLLCRSLNLKVSKWDQQQFSKDEFYMEDINYSPNKIIQTTRLGIPIGRDEHLLQRFIDYSHAPHCTQNPLNKKNWREGKEFIILAENK